jgi:hypothetical protein
MLPWDPHPSATLSVTGGGTPNTEGCGYYMFTIVSDEPVDYLYYEIELPTKISSLRVGLAWHDQNAKMTYQGYEFGKNSSGECDIVRSFVEPTADVQSNSVGPTARIHAAKLPERTRIIGAAACAIPVSGGRDVNYTGTYEYTIVGRRVVKKFHTAWLGPVKTIPLSKLPEILK